jgi:hypothetical protein
LVVEIRAAGWYRSHPRGETAHILGLIAGVAGLIGSVVLVGAELGVMRLGGWSLTLGLPLQFLGWLALIAWCLYSGYILRQAGVSKALALGIIGATFVGLPVWLAWLGKHSNDSPLIRSRGSP